MNDALQTTPANDTRPVLAEDFDAALKAYMDRLGANYKNVGCEMGRVYARVFWACSASRYVICFVHLATGDIHKADSWKKAGRCTSSNIFRI